MKTTGRSRAPTHAWVEIGIPLLGLTVLLIASTLGDALMPSRTVPREALALVCALFALLTWRRVALGPVPWRRPPFFKGSELLGGAMVAMLWSMLWLLLPAWGLLKLVSLLAFVPVMAWRWGSAGRRDHALGVWLGWGSVLCFVSTWLVSSPWRLERLVSSVWPAQPDLLGKHFAWGKLMDALAALSETGAGRLGMPPVLTQVDDAGWWLRVGADFGWVFACLAASALVLVWFLLTAWLASSPVGERLSLRNRRLGVALGLLHAFAAALYGAWSFGYLYRPMGALPPMSHAGWWVLSFALLVVAWKARQQRKVSRADTSLPLRMGWALVGMAWVAVSAGGIMHFPQHMAQWREAKAAARWPEGQRQRLELTDRTGKHLLVQNTLAYDIWVRPTDFWAASWANPKLQGTDVVSMSDTERETMLLDALSPWPQAASVAKFRMSQMDKAADGLKLLLWAQPWDAVPAIQARLQASGLNGVEVKQRRARNYPQGELTAHAVGFASLSAESPGQDGLELALNKNVSGWLSRNAKQNPIKTTLDLAAQRLAQSALRSAMEKHGASEGAVVVVDVATSEVRAMVSAPTFDPNNASTYRNPYQPKRLLNHATATPMALGSLLTPLLVADALQRGALQPDAVVDLGPKSGLRMGNTLVKDMNPAGQATLSEIVALSSNVGQAKLALQTTPQQLQTVLYGSRLQGLNGMIGLVGGHFETPNWEAWTDSQQAKPGQNLTSTLVRMVQAYMPIANGGIDRPLSLLSEGDRWIAGSVGFHQGDRRVLSEATACAVRRMLHQATSASGTAPLARVRGVSVAGKTGTNAHLPMMDDTGKVAYLPQSDAIFVGMAPAELPRYLVGVRLGFADGKPHISGQVAAPVFAQVVRGLVTTDVAVENDAPVSCPMP